MDEEIEVTPSGGRLHKIDSSITEIPQKALYLVGIVMRQGRETHGHFNWHNISVMSELDHALEHISHFVWQVDNCGEQLEAGAILHEDKTVIELSHAAARVMMALDQYVRRPDYLRETAKDDNRKDFGTVSGVPNIPRVPPPPGLQEK